MRIFSVYGIVRIIIPDNSLLIFIKQCSAAVKTRQPAANSAEEHGQPGIHACRNGNSGYSPARANSPPW